MTRDDQQQVLMVLAAIYLMHQFNREPSFAETFQEGVRRTRDRLNQAADLLERGGAWYYEALENLARGQDLWDAFDPGHISDLPGHQLTKEYVLALATQAGFPDPKLAAAIAFAESGGVPGAIARSAVEYSVGLWQINLMAHPFTEAAMKDPRKNAAAAFQISKGGRDWSPWTAYMSGQYRQFKTGIFA
jgi:Lysozyme like domain